MSTEFEAAPAVVADGETARWEASLPAAPSPVGTVLPVAAAQLTVAKPVEALGQTLSVTSYGVTHTIFGTAGSEPGERPNARPYLGEILTVATPSVSPPGVGEQNPAVELSVNDVVAAFGTNPDGKPVPDPQGGFSATTIDGAPSTDRLVRTVYGGVLDSIERNGPLTRLSDAVRGEATFDSPRPATATTGTVFGTRFSADGDVVFILGWLESSKEDTTREAPLGDIATLLKRPTTVVSQSDCTADNCRRHLAQEISDGLLELLDRELGRAKSIAVATASLVDAAHETARRANELTPPEDDSTVAMLETIEADLSELAPLFTGLVGELDQAAVTVTDWQQAVASGGSETLSGECEDRSTSESTAALINRMQRVITGVLELALNLPEPSSEAEQDSKQVQYAQLRQQAQQLEALFKALERIVESIHDTACATMNNMRV